MSYRNNYLFKVVLALDSFACALCFRDSCVTMSSVIGLRLRQSSPPLWARVLGKILNTIAKDHCEHAIHADTVRCQRAILMLESQ